MLRLAREIFGQQPSTELEPAEVEYELGFTSVLHPSEELLQAGLEKQLECTACSNTVLPPVLQCRKGHLYCKECKPPSNCCRLCKQTFATSPNPALERLLACIALPCPHRVRGCLQCVPLPDRARHEAGCAFRLVQCIHSKHGCTRTFLAKAENTPLTAAAGLLAVLSLRFWALHYTAV